MTSVNRESKSTEKRRACLRSDVDTWKPSSGITPRVTGLNHPSLPREIGIGNSPWE